MLPSIPGLETLCIRKFGESQLPQLVNLKELILLNVTNVAKMDILANNLVNIERLYINASIDEIMPFIRQSQKLNKIKLASLCKVLNLAKINTERKKLAGARKITMYVPNDVFLATKWATRNGDTNLEHIEMQRSDSFQWNHHYNLPKY